MAAQNIVGDSSGITHFVLNGTCVVAFTVVVAVYMPSKEPRYNWGNLIMHVFILYFYFIAHLQSPRVEKGNSAFDDSEALDVTLVGCQVLLCLYLVFVSFEKVIEIWGQAKQQVAAEERAKAKANAQIRRISMRDHTGASDHAENLSAHFPSDLSILLTRAHLQNETDAEEANPVFRVEE